jgi:hypothetical protein
MKFHLKTGFGTSLSSYNNTENNTTSQGVLQGSSSACSIFILNSNVSLSAYHQNAIGASFQHPISGQTIKDNAVQFVNDTSLFVNEHGLTSNSLEMSIANLYQQMLEAASSNAQLWVDYLWVAGGKLQLSKCFYYAFKPYINYKTNQISYVKLPTNADSYNI